jgi:hypothetical protein
LRYNFDASSSGFLLEGFLAALIHVKPVGGRGTQDIISYSQLNPTIYKSPGGRGHTEKKLSYQIKLYKNESNITINLGLTDRESCDYYVVALKEGESINVYIFNGRHPNREDYIGNYGVRERGTGKTIRVKEVDGIITKRYLELNTSKKEFKNLNVGRLTLNLSDIDSLIKRCGENVSKSISKLYDYISDLEYNTEAIITGYQTDRSPIEIDIAKKRADESIEKIQLQINDLHGQFNTMS